MPTGPISVNGLKNVFLSIETHTFPGLDEINFNVKQGYVLTTFVNFYNICFTCLSKKSTYLDDLKTAKVTPVFKAGDNTELSNYKIIFVLPCFSKKLEYVSAIACSRTIQILTRFKYSL